MNPRPLPACPTAPRRGGAVLGLAFSLALALGPLAVPAAEPAPAAPTPTTPPSAARERNTVFTLAVKGGWLMIPIGLCSVVVLTCAIERLVSLRRSRVGSPELLPALFSSLPLRGKATKTELEQALASLRDAGAIVSRVLASGVEKFHRDEAHAREILEEAALKEVHLLKRKLRPFDISIAVAPLLGLLGTIFGMISCFEDATAVDTASRSQTLANGIYVALVTTAAGLSVAIPALVVHHYFLGRLDRVQDEIEESVTEYLDHYYAQPLVTRPTTRHAPLPPGTNTSSAMRPEPDPRIESTEPPAVEAGTPHEAGRAV